MLWAKRILIVEDDAALAMVIEEYLTNDGATVLGIADSVSGAVKLIKDALGGEGINAVVLDLNLQGERAWPVADLLDAYNVPFVLQTGYIDLVPDGQMVMLAKPYHMESLLQVLAEVCLKVPKWTTLM